MAFLISSCTSHVKYTACAPHHKRLYDEILFHEYEEIRDFHLSAFMNLKMAQNSHYSILSSGHETIIASKIIQIWGIVAKVKNISIYAES